LVGASSRVHGSIPAVPTGRHLPLHLSLRKPHHPPRGSFCTPVISSATRGHLPTSRHSVQSLLSRRLYRDPPAAPPARASLAAIGRILPMADGASGPARLAQLAPCQPLLHGSRNRARNRSTVFDCLAASGAWRRHLGAGRTTRRRCTAWVACARPRSPLGRCSRAGPHAAASRRRGPLGCLDAPARCGGPYMDPADWDPTPVSRPRWRARAAPVAPAYTVAGPAFCHGLTSRRRHRWRTVAPALSRRRARTRAPTGSVATPALPVPARRPRPPSITSCQFLCHGGCLPLQALPARQRLLPRLAVPHARHSCLHWPVRCHRHGAGPPSRLFRFFAPPSPRAAARISVRCSPRQVHR